MLIEIGSIEKIRNRSSKLQNLKQSIAKQAKESECLKNNMRKFVKIPYNSYICVNFCFHMSNENNKLLVDLEVRIKQVLFLCDSLKDENARLKNEIQLKQKQIDQSTKEMEGLKTKYDNLKTARTITAASVDVEIAQEKLSKMVREVDKCINLLK